jgi:RHS repeat-associated protein
VIDPLGNLFQFTYDAAGRRIRLSMPGGIRDTSIYDNDDEVTQSIVFNGSTSTNKYPPATLRNQSFTFDAANRVLSMRNAAGLTDTILSTYAPLGHVVQRQYWQPVVSNFGVNGRIYDTERFSLDAMGNRFSSVDSTNLTSPTTTQMLRTGQSLRYNLSGSAPTGRLREIASVPRNDSTLYDADGNIEFSFSYIWTNPPPSTNLEDRASFYGADNRLRVAEFRTVPTSTAAYWTNWNGTFEEYRYDALGRRVLVRTRRMCSHDSENDVCKQSTMRRVVWDGNQELYEIQMPGLDADSTLWENDTAHVHQRSFIFPIVIDHNPQYGRVAYTHALGLDAPVAVTRINYVDSVYNKAAGFHDYPAFTVVPHWDWQGNADVGTMSDGGAKTCYPGEATRCVSPTWQHRTYAFLQNPADTLIGWYGSLLTDHKDASGMLYRRNRYVDPMSGRFTQEDPIGLAGGLNLYGFAAGDPVNFSDPFGLCTRKDGWKEPCWRPKDLTSWTSWKQWFSDAWTGRAAETGPADARQVASEAADITGAVGGLAKNAGLAAGRAAHVAVTIEQEVAEIVGAGAHGEIRIMGNLSREGDVITLGSAHIEGPGPGSSSVTEMKMIIEEFGRQQGASRVVVQGATRTTGRHAGRVPRPFIVDIPPRP